MPSTLALSPACRWGGAWERAAEEVRRAFADGRSAVLLDVGGAILACPGATATAAQLSFAIRYSSGLIHATVRSSWLDQLRVPDQPVLQSENSRTSFTVAVDAATGIGTGISARDRARTIRVLSDPDSRADDLTRPGHVMPIRCADAGFAEHARPWELASDLVEASGHPPIAVASRLIDEHGDLLDDTSATVFALTHGLPVLGAASLMDQRRQLVGSTPEVGRR